MSSRIAEELEALYGWSTDDIREFKHRQWQVAHYALLLYGVLGQISRDIAKGQLWLAIFVGTIGLVVAVFASGTLRNLQGAIELRRDRMAKIRADHFSAEFRAARLPDDNRGKEPSVGMFYFIVWVGLGVLIGYVRVIV